MANRDRHGREQRTYPHGSGDRNAWSPTGEKRMPKHDGGTQRVAPPGPKSRGPVKKSGDDTEEANGS